MGDEEIATGDLVTERGTVVPEIKLTAPMFLDRISALYGPTKSGKTVVIKAIMKLLSPHIEQIIVVSPTNPANKAYTGIVPQPLIHTRIYLPDPKNPTKDDKVKGAVRFLEAIWQRQEMMGEVHNRANQVDVLRKLFARLPISVKKGAVRYLLALDVRRQQMLARVRAQLPGEKNAGPLEEKITEINESFNTVITLVLKKHIVPYRHQLAKLKLGIDEQFSLQYLLFNRRILIIFDDCAAELKQLWKTDIMRKYFYQLRHVAGTCLFCFQDDTDLDTNFRKQIFTSIYTHPVVANANFERKSNNYPRHIAKLAGEIIPDVFQVKNRKLMYMREGKEGEQFYHFTAPYPRPFTFGSRALHEMCGRVETKTAAVDHRNPYFGYFKF